MQRSSASPSTTATCSTGTTTRASCPAPPVELSTSDGETYTVKRDGSEVALGEKAASGLFVRAA